MLPGAFGSEAERAIREAQAALSDLITEAGLEGVRAVDLARTLKLDKTLAWKLARFTDQSDPCSAFKHLPGQGGVEIVVKAAGNLGVTPDRLDAVRKADRGARELQHEEGEGAGPPIGNRPERRTTRCAPPGAFRAP